MNSPWECSKPIGVLAPMDDVTDTVFRRVVASCAAPDVFYTEFANADGLQSPGRRAVMQKLRFHPENEQPLIAQIWGLQPENYKQAATELVEMGFAGIDINMGCPVKNVVKNGACSALIQNPELAVRLIAATKMGAGRAVPVSVKTRLGWSEPQIDTWLRLLLEQDIAVLTVHLRTVKEMSKVPAHFELAKDIVVLRNEVAPQTKIILNGDIENRTHGEQICAEAGADGYMIGRGIFHDPYAFASKSLWPNMQPAQKIQLLRMHIVLHLEEWQGRRNYEALKRFYKIYINGFEGAADLRAQLMDTHQHKEALDIIAECDFSKKVKQNSQEVRTT